MTSQIGFDLLPTKPSGTDLPDKLILLVNLHHLATILKGSKTVAMGKRSTTGGEQSVS